MLNARIEAFYAGESGNAHATQPTGGECGGIASGTERYYSFDYGSIHFVCLDAMTSDRLVTGPMCAWLRADLDANTIEGRRNREVWDDLMHPWRQAESERGYRVQAGIDRSWMRNQQGALVQVPTSVEKEVAEKRGLLPVWRRGGQRIQFDDYGRLPNGHTHLTEPWSWQRETCPGCQRESL